MFSSHRQDVPWRKVILCSSMFLSSIDSTTFHIFLTYNLKVMRWNWSYTTSHQYQYQKIPQTRWRIDSESYPKPIPASSRRKHYLKLSQMACDKQTLTFHSLKPFWLFLGRRKTKKKYYEPLLKENHLRKTTLQGSNLEARQFIQSACINPDQNDLQFFSEHDVLALNDHQ